MQSLHEEEGSGLCTHCCTEMQVVPSRFCTECGDYTNCIVCIFYSLGARKCGR